ncbi:YicC/YloC family endoribonuclease [Roseinatronobacter sp.]|uniref:YicC/YloC family endoribonuclease n=1 Tax=Roseinatronobacter sp. TaxID=1945755 RepID=UPI00345BB295
MHSMTGYAGGAVSRALDTEIVEWEWDLRAVNGRGLDFRLRLPDGLGRLEKPLRDKLSARVARGNVTLGLRLRLTQGQAGARIDSSVLADVLAALDQVQASAQAKGVLLQAPTALDLLGWRGVLAQGPDLAAMDTDTLDALLLTDFDTVLDAFMAMRQREGQALAEILSAQLDEIARLTQAARALLDQRATDIAAHFRKALAQVQEQSRSDPARIEQELALLAVKADLAEELDRLEAHCAAGRALVQAEEPVGRKLDFLTQEFNREANTLCSKAQHLEMTRIGLDLKAVIDQMREQVQNVE